MRTIIDFINETNKEIFNDIVEDFTQSFYKSKSKEAVESKEASESNEVTELHMHKILFFIYGSFYKQFKIKLWEPNFEAWKYGPVEVNYRNFKKLDKSINIDELNIIQKKFLNEKIQSLLKTSIWNIVEFSHSLNCWINHYNSDNNKISTDEIMNDFLEILF